MDCRVTGGSGPGLALSNDIIQRRPAHDYVDPSTAARDRGCRCLVVLESLLEDCQDGLGVIVLESLPVLIKFLLLRLGFRGTTLFFGLHFDIKLFVGGRASLASLAKLEARDPV